MMELTRKQIKQISEERSPNEARSMGWAHRRAKSCGYRRKRGEVKNVNGWKRKKGAK